MTRENGPDLPPEPEPSQDQRLIAALLAAENLRPAADEMEALAVAYATARQAAARLRSAEKDGTEWTTTT